MESLFDEQADRVAARNAPLAVRMRPRTLDEFVGQADAVGPGTILRRAIESDELSPVILYGPPGSGKTTLARIIAGATEAYFAEVSAVASGVADIRKAIEAARDRLGQSGRRTILFIDEIHRFSKSQQDALLHAVEDAIVVLVGATTENPFFEVNAPLISRSRIIELGPLADDELGMLLERAVVDERGFGGSITVEPEAMDAIVLMAGGDARAALSTLETAAAGAAKAAVAGVPRVPITLDDVREAAPRRVIPYDKDADLHYDIVSAFIKSMRGGDPDAAVYWLARMVEGGENPTFIARRMLILASEDVGNADPQALLIAHAAFKAAESVGWPECRIVLSQAAIYLALARKSNASYRAIDAALAEVRTGVRRAVPNHLRDRSYRGAAVLGRGEGYLYPHDRPGDAAGQRYLPDGLERGAFWRPGQRGWEAERAGAEHEREPDDKR